MTKLKESRRGRIVTVGMVALFVLAMGALWWKGLFSGRGPARGIQVSAGPFRVSARFEPDPPHTGKNRVTLTVTDSSGAPVEGARVSGAAVMPAMGAMQEMRSDGTLTDLGGGRYQLVFDLAMEGPWPLSLEIQASDGGEANLDFDFKTGIPVRVAGGERRDGDAREG